LLETAIVDRLAAMRRSGESYSDVIMRLMKLEAGPRV
jgi:predicted CopG family antitoxin